MRWDVKKQDPWQRWFAWHPVKVGDQWVWWEYVERSFIGAANTYYTAYRLPSPERNRT